MPGCGSRQKQHHSEHCFFMTAQPLVSSTPIFGTHHRHHCLLAVHVVQENYPDPVCAEATHDCRDCLLTSDKISLMDFHLPISRVKSGIITPVFYAFSREYQIVSFQRPNHCHIGRRR